MFCQANERWIVGSHKNQISTTIPFISITMCYWFFYWASASTLFYMFNWAKMYVQTTVNYLFYLPKSEIKGVFTHRVSATHTLGLLLRDAKLYILDWNEQINKIRLARKWKMVLQPKCTCSNENFNICIDFYWIESTVAQWKKQPKKKYKIKTQQVSEYKREIKWTKAIACSREMYNSATYRI